MYGGWFKSLIVPSLTSLATCDDRILKNHSVVDVPGRCMVEYGICFKLVRFKQNSRTHPKKSLCSVNLPKSFPVLAGDVTDKQFVQKLFSKMVACLTGQLALRL
ncbi:hypothetical protein C8J57DRAFT_1235036 [Mycena rebaudengoi]|nr:hypothetical protein C8J57DRAFT_1235036 [Mycena rebaudengoi]